MWDKKSTIGATLARGGLHLVTAGINSCGGINTNFLSRRRFFWTEMSFLVRDAQKQRHTQKTICKPGLHCRAKIPLSTTLFAAIFFRKNCQNAHTFKFDFYLHHMSYSNLVSLHKWATKLANSTVIYMFRFRFYFPPRVKTTFIVLLRDRILFLCTLQYAIQSLFFVFFLISAGSPHLVTFYFKFQSSLSEIMFWLTTYSKIKLW